MMINEPEYKFIIEIKKGFTVDREGHVIGGEWEVLKDEFGAEKVFDYYFQAHRELKTIYPDVEFLGDKVGRVKEVEMIRRKQ